MATIRIEDGNAFKLRITGEQYVEEYRATTDMNVIDGLMVNFVRRGRAQQEASVDDAGRVVALNTGNLALGVYGVELTGYYLGEPWRYYVDDVFEIVDDGADTSSAVINGMPVYDVTFTITLGGSADISFVDSAILNHNNSNSSHPDLKQAIDNKVADVLVDGESVVETDPVTGEKKVDFDSDNFGKVDDVKVNGISVVSSKEANITIPTKTSDLLNDSEFVTGEEMRTSLDEKQDAISNVSIEYEEDGGEPDASVDFQDGDLSFSMKNMKMKFSDLTAEEKEEIRGPQGIPGDSVLVGQGDLPLSNKLDYSSEKAITPKTVTEGFDNVNQKVIEVINITGWTYSDYYINPSNLWKKNMTSYYGRVMSNADSKALRGKYIKVIPQSGHRVSIAFTKNYVKTDGTAVVYADGYSAKITSEIDNPLVVKVPDTTQYIYIHGKQGEYEYIPAGFAVLEYATMEDLYNDVDTLKTGVAATEDVKKAIERVDAVDYTQYQSGKLLKADGTVVDLPSSQASVIKTYNIDDDKKYYVSGRVPKSSDYCAVCFYDDNDDLISALFAGDGTTEAYDVVNAEITPPDGAVKVIVWGRTDYTAPDLHVSEGLIDVNEVRQDVETLKKHPLYGKKIAVIGDSISTIYNGNTPYITIQSGDVGQTIQSYVSWFDVYTNDAGTGLTNKTIGGITLTESMVDGELHQFVPVAADVGKELYVPRHYSGNTSDVKVWTKVLCEKTGATLLANASYSGGCMNSSEEITRGTLFKASHAWHPCTIGRCKVRDENGNNVLPDVVIIARGTNDLSFTDNGDYAHLSLDFPDMLDGFTETSDLVSSDNYNFVVAYILTIQALRNAYPNATIICTTPNFFKNVHYDVFPTRNDAHTYPEFCNIIRKIADYMACELIELDKDGITWQNCYPDYISDSNVHPIHPNSNGHRVMGEKAVSDTKNMYFK